MQEQLIVHTQSCKSCHFCESNCPKKAISITGEFNAKGYLTPVVDEDKCILCGTCYVMCPDYVYEIISLAEGEGQ